MFVWWLIFAVVIDFFYMYVCECSVGVDARNGTTLQLESVTFNIVMGCVVLGRQMNVDFSMSECMDTKHFVGMDARICSMKIHDSTIMCKQTINSIVVDRRIVQSYYCIDINTNNPTLTILHKITSCCCNSGTAIYRHSIIPTLFETTLRYINIGPTPFTNQTTPT